MNSFSAPPRNLYFARFNRASAGVLKEMIYFRIYTKVYTMEVAKVFKSGNSQAVRLPKAFRTEHSEFKIQKVGDTIMLTPIDDPWALFDEALDGFSEDFMSDGREQPEMQKREFF